MSMSCPFLAAHVATNASGELDLGHLGPIDPAAFKVFIQSLYTNKIPAITTWNEAFLTLQVADLGSRMDGDTIVQQCDELLEKFLTEQSQTSTLKGYIEAVRGKDLNSAIRKLVQDNPSQATYLHRTLFRLPLIKTQMALGDSLKVLTSVKAIGITSRIWSALTARLTNVQQVRLVNDLYDLPNTDIEVEFRGLLNDDTDFVSQTPEKLVRLLAFVLATTDSSPKMGSLLSSIYQRLSRQARTGELADDAAKRFLSLATTSKELQAFYLAENKILRFDDGTKITVNALQLTIYSPQFFGKLFNGNFKEAQLKEIPIKDITAKDFALLISLLERQNSNNEMPALLNDVIKTWEIADRLGITNLDAAFEQRLIEMVTPEYALALVKFAMDRKWIGLFAKATSVLSASGSQLALQISPNGKISVRQVSNGFISEDDQQLFDLVKDRLQSVVLSSSRPKVDLRTVVRILPSLADVHARLSTRIEDIGKLLMVSTAAYLPAVAFIVLNLTLPFVGGIATGCGLYRLFMDPSSITQLSDLESCFTSDRMTITQASITAFSSLFFLAKIHQLTTPLTNHLQTWGNSISNLGRHVFSPIRKITQTSTRLIYKVAATCFSWSSRRMGNPYEGLASHLPLDLDKLDLRQVYLTDDIIALIAGQHSTAQQGGAIRSLSLRASPDISISGWKMLSTFNQLQTLQIDLTGQEVDTIFSEDLPPLQLLASECADLRTIELRVRANMLIGNTSGALTDFIQSFPPDKQLNLIIHETKHSANTYLSEEYLDGRLPALPINNSVKFVLSNDTETVITLGTTMTFGKSPFTPEHLRDALTLHNPHLQELAVESPIYNVYNIPAIITCGGRSIIDTLVADSKLKALHLNGCHDILDVDILELAKLQTLRVLYLGIHNDRRGSCTSEGIEQLLRAKKDLIITASHHNYPDKTLRLMLKRFREQSPELVLKLSEYVETQTQQLKKAIDPEDRLANDAFLLRTGTLLLMLQLQQRTNIGSFVEKLFELFGLSRKTELPARLSVIKELATRIYVQEGVEKAKTLRWPEEIPYHLRNFTMLCVLEDLRPKFKSWANNFQPLGIEKSAIEQSTKIMREELVSKLPDHSSILTILLLLLEHQADSKSPTNIWNRLSDPAVNDALKSFSKIWKQAFFHKSTEEHVVLALGAAIKLLTEMD